MIRSGAEIGDANLRLIKGYFQYNLCTLTLLSLLMETFWSISDLFELRAGDGSEKRCLELVEAAYAAIRTNRFN